MSDAQVEEVGFKVFAGNLAYSTTDQGLKAFFAPVADDILSAQVIMRGPRSAGYGFVALATAEAAEKAVESLNNTELEGRSVIIEIAKPSDQKDKDKERKKYRRPGRRGTKAVPGEVTDAEANGEPPKADGADVPESSEAVKPKKKKKKSPRKPNNNSSPAVQTEAAGDADPDAQNPPAPETSPPTKKPRNKKPRAPRVPRPALEAPPGEPSKTMLFVANLGFSVDDDALRILFTEAGINVVSARVIRWRWGHPRKSKGYGFVDVANEEEQNKAIAALQGKEINNRPIVVKVAVNTSQADEANAAVDGPADGPAEIPA